VGTVGSSERIVWNKLLASSSIQTKHESHAY
jgi:hypothetical protein